MELYNLFSRVTVYFLIISFISSCNVFAVFEDDELDEKELNKTSCHIQHPVKKHEVAKSNIEDLVDTFANSAQTLFCGVIGGSLGLNIVNIAESLYGDEEVDWCKINLSPSAYIVAGSWALAGAVFAIRHPKHAYIFKELTFSLSMIPFWWFCT